MDRDHPDQNQNDDRDVVADGDVAAVAGHAEPQHAADAPVRDASPEAEQDDDAADADADQDADAEAEAEAADGAAPPEPDVPAEQPAAAATSSGQRQTQHLYAEALRKWMKTHRERAVRLCLKRVIMRRYASNLQSAPHVNPDFVSLLIDGVDQPASESAVKPLAIRVSDPLAQHPHPGRELFSATREVDDRVQRALDTLDAPQQLSPALEHALWGVALRSRQSEFKLENLGVSFTRLEVAYLYYVLLPLLQPIATSDRQGNTLVGATLKCPPGFEDARVLLSVVNYRVLDDVINMRATDPSSFYTTIDSIRATQQALRHARIDAPLPTTEGLSRFCVILAAKNVFSVVLPEHAALHEPQGQLKEVTALHLLPVDPLPVIDQTMRPRDAAAVLTRLAVFANDHHHAELAVVLCQYALARWHKSAVTWVALHNALRRLGAAVRLSSMNDELFNPADCYLEALKHDYATSVMTNGATNRDVETARASVDLTPRAFIDEPARHWMFTPAAKITTFAAVAAICLGTSALLRRKTSS